MVTRLFLGYLLVESIVLAALVSAIGFGRALLVLLVVFGIGLAVSGSQIRRQMTKLRSGAGAMTESMLVALGTVLVVVPGLVSTVIGLLLLLPVTRAVARPVVTALVAAGLGRRAPLITAVAFSTREHTRRPGRADFIDGEVLDVTDVTDAEPPVITVRPTP